MADALALGGWLLQRSGRRRAHRDTAGGQQGAHRRGESPRAVGRHACAILNVDTKNFLFYKDFSFVSEMLPKMPIKHWKKHFRKDRLLKRRFFSEGF